MADQIKLKKFKNPDDPDSFILVPVRYLVPLFDTKIHAQGKVYRLNNGAGDPRQVHVKRVMNSDGNGDYIECERIEAIWLYDPKTHAQVKALRLANDDPPPRQMGMAEDEMPKHARVHVVRITADQTPDGEPWVEIERIDVLPTYDPKTNASARVYRFAWPELGPPVAGSNFNATHEVVNVDELSIDDQDSTAVDPPMRIDFTQNPVDINWGGVVEFETDKFPVTVQVDGRDKKVYQPYVGSDLVGMAILHQAVTAIADFGVFLASIFFDLPPDGDSPSIARFIEWGGNGTLPEASRIEIVTAEGLGPTILCRLIGPTRTVTWGGSGNFYSLPDWLPATRVVGSFIDVQCPLPPVYSDGSGGVSSDKFNDEWHALQISVANPGSAFTAPTLVNGWIWVVESGTSWSDATYTVSLDVLLHTELGDLLDTAGLGAMKDPRNAAGSTILDLGNIDLSSSPLQDFMPDPASLAGTRLYVRFRPTNPSGYPPYNQNDYLGLKWTSMPTTALALTDTVAARLFLDGKDHLFDDGSGAGSVRVNQFTWPDGTTPDSKSGFVINGSEIGMPRFAGPPSAGAGRPIDKRRRHAKVQMWFGGSFVDLSDPTKLAKFVTLTTPVTPPPGATQVLNPAKLSDADREAYRLLGVPPNEMLSPAAIAFGKPDIYFDGTPVKFVQNRGKGGDFTVVNDIINYSPGPKDIPVV